MAKRCYGVVIAGGAMLFALAGGGCQPQEPVSMVATLPAPNFDGPDLSPTPPPAPTPPPRPAPPLAQVPAAPAPRPGDVPAEWVPSIRANAWRWIVIHHSATPRGGARAFDREHRDKGWDELGYHFVVGNGSETRDGQVEVGSRWRKQKWGAHAKTPDNRYNEYGIGICLVGNFDVSRPSWRQVEAAAKLVAHLQRTYNIPSERVIGHGAVHSFDKAGTSTACPGRNLNVAQIRQLSNKMIAEAGGTPPAGPTASAAGKELLHDVTAQVGN